jgi:uncharacterized membrane protein YbhN (UPF0104 family)
MSDGEDTHERHVASHIFNIVVLVIGFVALGFMMQRLGWQGFINSIEGIGWWFAVVLVLDAGSTLCDAAALNTFMRPEARMVSYWRVLAAQLSGRAINLLTPGGTLGEATKLTLLVSRAPRSRVLSSIVLLNLANVYISVAAMVIGTPLTFLLLDIPPSAKVPIMIGLGIVSAGVIAIGVLIHRGAVGTLVILLRRMHVIDGERAKNWLDRLVEVDRHIRELHQNRSVGTWKGILWVGASKVLTWAATIVLLAAVGTRLDVSIVVGVLSVGQLINWVSAIVPMGVGISEGGNYALFDLLGASGEHGMILALVTRARSLIFAVLGLAIMGVMHTLDRIALARMHRKLRELKARAMQQ